MIQLKHRLVALTGSKFLDNDTIKLIFETYTFLQKLEESLEDPTMGACSSHAEGYRNALLDIKKQLGISDET